MDNQNQVPPQTQSSAPQTPTSPISPPSPESSYKEKSWKIVGIILISIIVIFSLLVWYDSRLKKQDKNLSNNSQNNNQQNNLSPTISLLGNVYKKGFTPPASTGTDYASESYEWVKDMETVENWKTLITTHKFSHLNIDKPFSAEAYAQNVTTLLTENGATIIETSIFNTEAAAKEGVDISNPPYLLVYAFSPANKSGQTEFNFQKIENSGEGKVSTFIYAERVQISSGDELKAFLSSPSFFEKRTAVVLEKFPY